MEAGDLVLFRRQSWLRAWKTRASRVPEMVQAGGGRCGASVSAGKLQTSLEGSQQASSWVSSPVRPHGVIRSPFALCRCVKSVFNLLQS